jgi:hypothetical protein
MSWERDPLDELLSRGPGLPVGDFTERVLGRLPPRRRDLRPWALAAAGGVAGALGLLSVPPLVHDLLAALSSALGG